MMKILSSICFAFLVNIATACVIPLLARNLYPAPTITSPKNEENVPRDKIKIAWTALPRKANLDVLDGLPYKLQIRGSNDKVDNYKTKDLFVSIKGIKYAPGTYQARVAASGFFGTGAYSKVVQFNVINGTNVTAAQNVDGKNTKNPSNPMVPGRAPGKPKDPAKPEPKFTKVPELLEPKTGDKVAVDDIFFEWTQVKKATAYKLELTGDSSEEFELTKSSCNKCKPKKAGSHKVKAAAIVDNEVGEWGPEVTFDVTATSNLKVTKLINPLQESWKSVPVEFQWDEGNAKTYALEITTPGRTIKVQTWMYYYTMWHFRHVGSHHAKVMGFNKFESSKWCSEIRFNFGLDPPPKVGETIRYTGPHAWMETQYGPYKPTIFRPAPGWKLEFCPVFSDWMKDICREFNRKGLNCDGDHLDRPQGKNIRINNWNRTTTTIYVPNGKDSFYKAISYVITNNLNHDLEIRELVCNEVEHDEEFYILEGTNFAEYMFDLRINKRKPSMVEISATANLLQTTIWIFGYFHPSTWIDFQPRTPKYKEAIFLIYTSRFDHFAPVFNWV